MIQELKEKVNSSPYRYLRVVDAAGKKLLSSSVSDKDQFNSKLETLFKAYTGPAILQGKQSQQDKDWINLYTINPQSGSAPLVSAGSSKAEANFSLLQENAKLSSKAEVLEYQNQQLLSENADLKKAIAELENQLAELEEEVQPPGLSEPQNMWLELAKPLLPGLQAFAFHYLSKYIPQPNQQPNELPGTEIDRSGSMGM